MDRTAKDGSKQYLDGLITAISNIPYMKEQGREQLKWPYLTGDGRKEVMKVFIMYSLL